MGQTAAPAATDDAPHPRRSEPDLCRFVSFTLFSLLLEGQFCFVLFCFLQCHRLPCSSFNFLIEDCIYRCPFFVLFLKNCDQFWLNVITAVFQKNNNNNKKPPGSCSQYLMFHLAMHGPSRQVVCLQRLVWWDHPPTPVMLGPSFDLGHRASQQSGQLYFSLVIINIVIFVAACCACHHAAGPGGISSESPVHH